MTLGEKVFAAILIIFGGATLLCVGAALWASRRGPSSGEREAVGEAPGIRLTPGEFNAVMASVDGAPVVPGRPEVQWQADVERFYADYDTYRTELRLPGEGR